MMSVSAPMSGEEAPAVGGDDVDDDVAELYRYAVRVGRISSCDDAATALRRPVNTIFSSAASLMELGLLRTDTATGHGLVPVSAELAAARLITPIEQAMFARRELVDQLRERIQTVTRGQSSTDQVGVIDGLEGLSEIRGMMKLAADACRDEALVLRSSGDQEEAAEAVLDACYSVLAPTVALRVICPHGERVSFDSRARAKRLADAGAAIRTASQVPRTAVVLDRSLAVVLTFPDRDGVPSARRVRDATFVRFLVDLFDQMWAGASRFNADEPAGYAEVADDLQHAVARLMAQGFTDEVVARRLGMSVRTCRRHIAALLHELDSVSRFQAGVHAARRLNIEAT
jgi:DNA-binding CsgD family transcriptional regulator